MERNSGNDGGFGLPELPIVEPEASGYASLARKYGVFFYLALIGLVLLAALCLSFIYNLWVLRDIWRQVYLIHDTSRPEEMRVNAAWYMIQDPRVQKRQLQGLLLQGENPPMVRYLAAEALADGDTYHDPRRYAADTATHAGFSPWIRLLRVRALAYAAGKGGAIAQRPLRELAGWEDPYIRVWATYTLAQSSSENVRAARDLEAMARSEDGFEELAGLLLSALRADDEDRRSYLDRATVWTRTHQPDLVEIWRGWRLVHGHFEREPATRRKGDEVRSGDRSGSGRGGPS